MRELLDNGVAPATISVQSLTSEREALGAEMKAESDHAVFAGFAPMTKEQTQGAAVSIVVFGLIGAVIGALLALIPFGLVWWARLLLLAGIGAAAGSTIGFIAGAGVAGAPVSDAAAEQGVAITVRQVDDAVLDVLRRADPIRLDVLDDEDERLATLVEESSAKRLGRNAKRTLDDPQRGSDWASGGRRLPPHLR